MDEKCISFYSERAGISIWDDLRSWHIFNEAAEIEILVIGKRCSVCHYYIKKAKLKGGPPILKKTFGVTVAVVKSLFRKPNDKNRNFQIIDTDRIRVRQFYDSKWFIYFHDGGEQKSIQITRDDMEEKNSLMNRLRECTSVDDIRALDLRNSIYYD